MDLSVICLVNNEFHNQTLTPVSWAVTLCWWPSHFWLLPGGWHQGTRQSTPTQPCTKWAVGRHHTCCPWAAPPSSIRNMCRTLIIVSGYLAQIVNISAVQYLCYMRSNVWRLKTFSSIQSCSASSEFKPVQVSLPSKLSEKAFGFWDC